MNFTNYPQKQTGDPVFDAIVVSLNPCMDWSWHIDDFVYGGMNRVQSNRADAAGKGINVCMALKNLGRNPLCTGFNFRENNTAITAKLDEANIPHDFVTLDGNLRVNIKLYDASGAMTELNQPGASVPPEAQDKLMDKIINLTKTHHNEAQKKQIDKITNKKTAAPPRSSPFLVLAGSRPAGVGADFYSRLCTAWPGRTILDTEGEALRLAIGYDSPPPPRVPYLIKPNLYELESTFNVTLRTHDAITAFCRGNIICKGVEIVCVSLGAEGAMLITPDEALFSPAIAIDVKAVQGAGDAMVAGLVYALTNPKEPITKEHTSEEHISEEHMYKEYTPKTCTAAQLLRYGMAAAAATVTREGTQMCDRAGFETMLERLSPSP